MGISISILFGRAPSITVIGIDIIGFIIGLGILRFSLKQLKVLSHGKECHTQTLEFLLFALKLRLIDRYKNTNTKTGNTRKQRKKYKCDATGRRTAVRVPSVFPQSNATVISLLPPSAIEEVFSSLPSSSPAVATTMVTSNTIYKEA